jgi:hypothetical protein
MQVVVAPTVDTGPASWLTATRVVEPARFTRLLVMPDRVDLSIVTVLAPGADACAVTSVIVTSVLGPLKIAVEKTEAS